MSVFTRYFPLVTSLSAALGVGFFATAIYASNGGFVSQTKSTEKSTIREPRTPQESFSRVEDLPLVENTITLPEVTVSQSRRHRVNHQRSQRKWVCRERELEQGGGVETPTVNSCEWVEVRH